MSNAININKILESDNYLEFIEFLKTSNKTKNIKLILSAFEDFMPASAVKCKDVITFIRKNENTDIAWLLEQYETQLNTEQKQIKFYSNIDLSK